jgi:Uma2 family endonuclease
MTAVILNLDAVTTLTHEQFWELSLTNRDVRLELTAQGKLIVMPPTGWESGKRNMKLGSRLNVWSELDGLELLLILLRGSDSPMVLCDRRMQLGSSKAD